MRLRNFMLLCYVRRVGLFGYAGGKMRTKSRMLACWFCSFSIVGERSQDKEDLLQEQGVQKTHFAQGHTVQEGEG